MKPITVPVRSLLRRKCISHVRPATKAIADAMQSHLRCEPLQFTGDFTSASLSQLQRQLRKALARNLIEGDDEAAFAKACGVDSRPRADDLEGMYENFPYVGDIDWTAPDVHFGLHMPTWRLYHSFHCRQGCTRYIVQPHCYFIYLEYFLRTGFEPALEPSAPTPHDSLHRAYVDMWHDNKSSCERALTKWLESDVTFISPVTSIPPASCCALLPVIKARDLWKQHMLGMPKNVKARLCLDLKTSGDNKKTAPWLFRYLVMQLVFACVKPTDYLTVLDIDQFYMRLAAGRRMRRRQWFQDPTSFATSNAANKRQHVSDKLWRQLLSVAFGWKTAPAYASTVSAELVRILRACGVRAVGTFIDDILIASDNKDQADKDVALAILVMAIFKLPANAKQKGPAPPHVGVPFVGIHIRPVDFSLSITAEYRQYMIERLEQVVKLKHVTYKMLESIAHSLTWLCEVMLRGRPRRAHIFAALARASEGDKIPMRGDLSHQMYWWLHELKSPRAQMIRYWRIPPTRPLCLSDASGEDGWAACVMGLHFVGRWPRYMRQSSGTSPECMLFMETLPIVVVMAVLAPFLQEKLLCTAVDNAGAAFSINAFNCRDAATRKLMQILVDAVSRHKSWVIAGHGRRHRNTHTDLMTHAISDALWDQVMTAEPVRAGCHVYHFALMSTATRECFTAAITFKKTPPLPIDSSRARTRRR